MPLFKHRQAPRCKKYLLSLCLHLDMDATLCQTCAGLCLFGHGTFVKEEQFDEGLVKVSTDERYQGRLGPINTILVNVSAMRSAGTLRLSLSCPMTSPCHSQIGGIVPHSLLPLGRVPCCVGTLS